MTVPPIAPARLRDTLAEKLCACVGACDLAHARDALETPDAKEG